MPDSFQGASAACARGDWATAERECRRHLQAHPRDAEAWHLLGTVLWERGERDESVRCLRSAHAMDSRNPRFLVSLGRAQLRLGQAEAAVSSLQSALRRSPGDLEAHGLLGNALKKLERFPEALEHLRLAADGLPDNALWRADLGLAYLAARQMEGAERELTQALALDPREPEIHFDLGVVYLTAGRLAEADGCFSQALLLHPDHVGALINQATLMKSRGELDGAIEKLRRAVALDPGHADGWWNLSLGLLQRGEWDEGWALYEWRRRIPGLTLDLGDLACWDGSAEPGKTLFVHAEQGLGDTLQFSRFLRTARERVGTLVFAPQKALRPLLGLADLGVDAYVDPQQGRAQAHCHAPLMSLPWLLRARPDGLGQSVPYLVADPARVERWKARLARSQGVKIGLCWQGNPTYREDRLRSIPLRAFAGLMRPGGARWFGLQKEYGLEQLDGMGPELGFVDLGPELDREGGAFMDTAALMMALDVVITSDTAIAHLGGALACPTWLLLARTPDWRWGLCGERSEWYPSLRLFRQKWPGDWDEVIARVGQALDQQFRLER